MDAIVLVGGEGTRMRPLTYDTPKQMLPVVDRPLIEHVAGWLAGYGVRRLVLSLGYRPDAFVEAYPDGELLGVELVCATEPEPLDTAGALRFAATAAATAGRFLVLNGDVLTDFDLSALVDFHLARKAEASIYLTPVPDPSAFGVVPTDAEGRVVAFIEKPAAGSAPTNLVNAGTYVLEPSVLERIPSGRRASIERETFPRLVEEGALFALASEAYWLDTGTPAKYIEAQLDVLHHRRGAVALPRVPEEAPGVFLAPSCSVAGVITAGCYVGPGARVQPGAQVTDSVLGENVDVGPDAVVHKSVVMAGAVVGKGAVIESSIVGPAALVGKGAQVSDLSVLRGSSKIEPGAVLAGARYPSP